LVDTSYNFYATMNINYEVLIQFYKF
jgi:hypothetical protein